MPAPFELVAGLADLWLAPVNTADPPINAAPPGAWIKLGVAGSKDYSEDGVMAAYEQDTNDFFGLGGTGARKSFRSRERFHVSFKLHDATLEALAHAWNEAAITTLAGPPAEKTIPILQGGTVSLRALLIRPAGSPYLDSANPMQVWLPLVYQKANFELAFKKADPIGVALDFFALQDDTNAFGKIHAPTT